MKNAKGFDIVKGTKNSKEYMEIIFYQKYENRETYEMVGKIKFEENRFDDYAYGAILFTKDNFEDLKRFYKIMEDIKNYIEHWESNFNKVFRYLEENYYRIVYDYRVNGYIREIDRPDETQKSYVLTLDGDYMYSILAESIEVAEELLRRRVKNELENEINPYGRKEQFIEWLENPTIKLDKQRYYNKIDSLEEIVNS